MLRTFFADRRHGDHPDFTWRGTDVSRLKGFSDGVFGFAVTLLVVSLDVPDNYAQFWAAMLNTHRLRSASRCSCRYGMSTIIIFGATAWKTAARC